MGSLNGVSSWEECHVMTHFTPFMKAHWRGSTFVVIYRWIFQSTFSHPYLNEDKVSIVIVVDPLNKYIKFPRKSLFSYMSGPVDDANEHWSVRDGKVANFSGTADCYSIGYGHFDTAKLFITISLTLLYILHKSYRTQYTRHILILAHDSNYTLEIDYWYLATRTYRQWSISQQHQQLSLFYPFMRKSLLEENRYESNNEMDQIYTRCWKRKSE